MDSLLEEGNIYGNMQLIYIFHTIKLHLHASYSFDDILKQPTPTGRSGAKVMTVN